MQNFTNNRLRLSLFVEKGTEKQIEEKMNYFSYVLREASGENVFSETKLCPVWRKHFLAAGAELFSAVYIP